MSSPAVSILLTPPKDLRLFKRCLWALAFRSPKMEFEVLIASDTKDALPCVEAFTSVLSYKYLLVGDAGEKAYAYAQGRILSQDGRCIAWDNAYDQVLNEPDDAPRSATVIAMPEVVDRHLDIFGANLHVQHLAHFRDRIVSGEFIPVPRDQHLFEAAGSVGDRRYCDALAILQNGEPGESFWNKPVAEVTSNH